jgi:dipeptide/tripeptide permease
MLQAQLSMLSIFRRTSSPCLVHNAHGLRIYIVGGILSDSWLGKFWTILFLSIVYCIGSIILAVTSLPGATGDPPKPWGCFLGLALLAFGTGGIKPCVSSFGGDQFHTTQTKTIAIFFSVFYFMVNAGSVLSMWITPILRSVHGFGQKSCYPLAFGLPAVLMLVATMIFVTGYKLYRHVEPQGNIVLKVVMASCYAIKCKLSTSIDSRPVQHWLDRAYPRYERHFLQDCKRLFHILFVLAPASLFWALNDQQGSRWTYQALMMSPHVELFGQKYAIKPEQMGIVNAFLILALIPFFNSMAYPALERFGLKLRPLQRMLWGMILAASSFAIAAILQFTIVSRGNFAPNPEDPQSLVCLEGCVHVLAQIPQYVLLTAGEIMFSITGLEFAYSQAPGAMKSVCGAVWLLTVASGNLVFIVFNELDPVKRVLGPSNSQLQSWNFVFWASVLIVGMTVFGWISSEYHYFEDLGNADDFNEANDALKPNCAEGSNDSLLD